MQALWLPLGRPVCVRSGGDSRRWSVLAVAMHRFLVAIFDFRSATTSRRDVCKFTGGGIVVSLGPFFLARIVIAGCVQYVVMTVVSQRSYDTLRGMETSESP